MRITETHNETIQLEKSLYDLALLEEMDDVGYLLEIIDTLLDESPRELKEMKEALIAGERDTVAKKAHKLKSTSGVIQAETLTSLLAEIENQARAGTVLNELSGLVEAALFEYNRIEDSLKEYAEGLKL